ncbi:MAG: PLDc N-terminal domain-containing protein [Anaerolineae bacterium]|nr:PLDc N-terminal domain-containing protein [Anaerolineae bacterium]
MDAIGLNEGFLLIQCVLPAFWLLLSFFALLRLRQCSLPETAAAIWAVFIVVVPFLGALAFLIVRPGDQST